MISNKTLPIDVKNINPIAPTFKVQINMEKRYDGYFSKNDNMIVINKTIFYENNKYLNRLFKHKSPKEYIRNSPLNKILGIKIGALFPHELLHALVHTDHKTGGHDPITMKNGKKYDFDNVASKIISSVIINGLYNNLF